MDIPSTQNWKVMKTISRKRLSTGAVDQKNWMFRTFSLGVVQPTAIVRNGASNSAYLNSRYHRPVEGNQTFAVKYHVGAGVS